MSLLQDAVELAEQADHERVDRLTDLIGKALESEPRARPDVFLAMVQVLAGVLAQEHCDICRRIYASQLMILSCTAADKHMERTKH